MESPKLPTLSYLLLDPAKPFVQRDLSWIQFNDRVLAEARDRDNPLLKRLKFLSISASNLDEFFMIRVASLLRSAQNAKSEETRANLQRVHGTLLESVRKFGFRQARTLAILRQEGAKRGIHLHLQPAKDSEGFVRGARIFREKILPQLVTKEQFHFSAFQDLRNLQMLAYFNKDLYFEVPLGLPPVFWEIDSNALHAFFLDDLVLTHLEDMLPLKEKGGILRLTRDADFTVDLSDNDPESIPDLIRRNLGSREKGRMVRLQHLGHFPKDFLQEATDRLKLDLRHCLKAPGSLCLMGLLPLVTELPEAFADAPGMSNPPLRPMTPTPFLEPERANLFTLLRRDDIILHHPYDSFDAFLSWLRLACEDPTVTQIEQTIYRTDSSSEIVALLKDAASRKKIRVLLELRARFDESNNLRVAEELSKAGAEVSFGFGDLKLHAKITLVTRREGESLVRYTHLSTGNYSSKTARLYTDISILTGNQEIGDDARLFFDAVARKEVPGQFRHLVTAPTRLHQRIRSLIKAETEAAKAGKPARIMAKVNALVDEKIIEDLYAASQAGVKIDLIVRGACSLIPGVKGLSENVRVLSIVDRFLEHSRIYYFENEAKIYLSSADWMPRNFFSRLEIAFPVLDPRLYRYFTEILIPGYMNDNTKARQLTARGTWRPPRPGKPHRAQLYFQELAERHYEGTPLFGRLGEGSERN